MLIYQLKEDNDWPDEAPDDMEKEYYTELRTLKYYGEKGLIEESRRNDLARAEGYAETEIQKRLRLLNNSEKLLLLDRCLRDAKTFKAEQSVLFTAERKARAEMYKESENIKETNGVRLDIPRPKNIFDERVKTPQEIYQDTKKYKYHLNVAAGVYKYRWVHRQNILSIKYFIKKLENKRSQLPDADIPILKLPPASTEVVNTIGISCFPTIEKSLLDRGYIDADGRWQKTKTANELAGFIWALKNVKYLKNKRDKINKKEKDFFSTRYNMSKEKLIRKTIPSNKTKIKTEIALFSSLIKPAE